MLKELEKIIELSQNYVQTSNEYGAQLKQLKERIEARLNAPRYTETGFPQLNSVHVTATDDGHLRLDSNEMKIVNGTPTFEAGITISYEEILRIAAALQEGVS